MNGSTEIFTLVYEANGCSADDEGYLYYRQRPDHDDYETVNSWFVPEGFTTLFALYKRTARCCGSGRHFIAIDTDHQKLHMRAVELNLGVVQPEGLSMTDSEWMNYTETGQWPHPYGIMALEEDVPRTPTDEEMATLPVLDLDEFDRYAEDNGIPVLGLSEDIFSLPYEEGVKAT